MIATDILLALLLVVATGELCKAFARHIAKRRSCKTTERIRMQQGSAVKWYPIQGKIVYPPFGYSILYAASNLTWFTHKKAPLRSWNFRSLLLRLFVEHFTAITIDIIATIGTFSYLAFSFLPEWEMTPGTEWWDSSSCAGFWDFKVPWI